LFTNYYQSVYNRPAFCHIKDVRREANLQQLWR